MFRNRLVNPNFLQCAHPCPRQFKEEVALLMIHKKERYGRYRYPRGYSYTRGYPHGAV